MTSPRDNEFAIQLMSQVCTELRELMQYTYDTKWSILQVVEAETPSECVVLEEVEEVPVTLYVNRLT
ncbi:hypothetical protein NDU88_003825 [Pleurodeles waltl]|uniref:Uncharacterized protein n=1 Tax=Pleurodeles waltl TaxID=8319 RepID=A0AAV7VIF3_PLEWA|nr:hypothetical protein NDU88_003825 [Pleurodeles waltl]